MLTSSFFCIYELYLRYKSTRLRIVNNSSKLDQPHTTIEQVLPLYFITLTLASQDHLHYTQHMTIQIHSALPIAFAANGITCLALQNYCIGALRIVMHRISPQVNVQSWPASLVIAAATMIVVGAAAWLISRYAPWLLGREKKTVNFQH